MRTSFCSLALVLFPTLLLGCAATTADTTVTLEITASADVDSIEISVRDGAGVGIHESRRRVSRTVEELAMLPARIEVGVPLGAVEVHLHDEEGGLMASRCYQVTGPLEDDVHLMALGAMDLDGDGWTTDAELRCHDRGVDGSPIACDIGACPAEIVRDCDDGDPARFPRAPTICANGIDENCLDEGLPGGDEPCADLDGDGFAACAASDVPGTCDCDDSDPETFPGASEPCGMTRDRDCDGRSTECDADGDGFFEREDCDDGDAGVHPGAQDICEDAIDQDCNGRADDALECIADDLDRDGYARCEGARDCSRCDCDDCNGGVYPGAEEVCDGIDQDTGEPVPASGDPFPDCPGDTDGDGVVGASDCDETDRNAYLGAAENCDTPRLESCVSSSGCSGEDADGDGYVIPEDCDDGNAAVHPGAAEVCNGVDDDCDGVLDEVSTSGVGCISSSTSCGTALRCTVVFESDDLHCGGCAIRCAVGERCVSGGCVR